jgi:hypothetical protein
LAVLMVAFTSITLWSLGQAVIEPPAPAAGDGGPAIARAGGGQTGG